MAFEGRKDASRARGRVDRMIFLPPELLTCVALSAPVDDLKSIRLVCLALRDAVASAVEQTRAQREATFQKIVKRVQPTYVALADTVQMDASLIDLRRALVHKFNLERDIFAFSEAWPLRFDERDRRLRDASNCLWNALVRHEFDTEKHLKCLPILPFWRSFKRMYRHVVKDVRSRKIGFSRLTGDACEASIRCSKLCASCMMNEPIRIEELLPPGVAAHLLPAHFKRAILKDPQTLVLAASRRLDGLGINLGFSWINTAENLCTLRMRCVVHRIGWEKATLAAIAHESLQQWLQDLRRPIPAQSALAARPAT